MNHDAEYAGYWDASDVDADGPHGDGGRRTRKEATALVLTREIGTRSELRAQVAAAGVSLSGVDAAVAAAIGALGAIPGAKLDEHITAVLGNIPGMDMIPWDGGAPSGREAVGALQNLLKAQAGSPEAALFTVAGRAQQAAPLLHDFIQQVGLGAELGEPLKAAMQSFVSWANAEAGSSLGALDRDDVFGGGLVAWLSGMWVQHRGWNADSKVFHEFKALAYGGMALFSLPFNPNPLALGISAFHLVKAMLASRALTKQIVELTELAVAEARAAMDEWDAAVRGSAQTDAWVAQALQPPMLELPGDAAKARARLRKTFGGA